MSQIKSYIQYLDELQNIKIKPLLASFDGDGELQYYFLQSSINEQFFILSVFINQKRVDSVDFVNCENLFMLSVINDLSMVDLNTIPLNEYFQPSFAPKIKVLPSSSVVSGGSVSSSVDYFGSLQSSIKPNPIPLTDKYGVVFPTIVTQKGYQGVYYKPFPVDYNVKTLELAISHNAGNPTIEISYLTYLKGDYGDFNSGEKYHDYERNIVSIQRMPCFNIDDIFIKFFDWGITRDYLYRITVYPNYNFVVVDCDGFDVSSLEENHNYTSTRRIQYSGQDSDYLLIGIDWKKYPTLFGS